MFAVKHWVSCLHSLWSCGRACMLLNGRVKVKYGRSLGVDFLGDESSLFCFLESQDQWPLVQALFVLIILCPVHP